MRAGDLIDDKSPRPEPPPARVRSALERQEDALLLVGGERRALVADADAHGGGGPLGFDDDGRVRRAVCERVLEEVPDHLRNAVGVERSAQVAHDLEQYVAAGVTDRDLVHHLAEERRKVDLAPLDGDAAPEARLGEIEQVADHAPHPVAGRGDARCCRGDSLRKILVAEDEPGAGDDGGERRAQVVSEHPDELLAEARGPRCLYLALAEEIALPFRFLASGLLARDVLEEERDVCDAPLAIGNREHGRVDGDAVADRKSTRLNSSHANISYAVFCLKK